eukprot:symbB.v1.2.035320.t1/scaffold4725.1/size35780/2
MLAWRRVSTLTRGQPLLRSLATGAGLPLRGRPTAFGRPVSPTLQALPMAHMQMRWGYDIKRVVNWWRNKRYALEVENRQRTTKNRNHAEVLKRFRLSRFGWQRRRARLRD